MNTLAKSLFVYALAGAAAAQPPASGSLAQTTPSSAAPFEPCDDGSTPTCPGGAALKEYSFPPCADGKPVCADGTDRNRRRRAAPPRPPRRLVRVRIRIAPRDPRVRPGWRARAGWSQRWWSRRDLEPWRRSAALPFSPASLRRAWSAAARVAASAVAALAGTSLPERSSSKTARP